MNTPGAAIGAQPGRRLLLAQVAITLVAFFAGAVRLVTAQGAAPASLHLVLAVGVMPLMFAAMLHFVPVLTRSGEPHAAVRALPVLALLAGCGAFMAFGDRGAGPLLFVAAAGLGFLAAVGMALWILWRASEAVGAPHPCAHWYAAALACLAAALLAMLLIHAWPGAYLVVKRIHLHLNLLGFVAITAVGTLHVLLPTVTGRDGESTAHLLRFGLRMAAGGAVLAAAGAAWAPLMSLAGALLAVIAPAALAAVAWREMRAGIVAPHGAGPLLGAALAGYLAALGLGALHALGVGRPEAALLAFFTAFLAPLVTGALTWLLPLWLRPGGDAAWRDAARAALGRWNGIAAVAHLATLPLALALPQAAAALAAAAVTAFLLKAVAMPRPAIVAAGRSD